MRKTELNLFQSIKDSLPNFIKEQFPLFGELLEEYYISLEKNTGAYDILTRINKYINVDEIDKIVDSSILSESIFNFETEIPVVSTQGFPTKNGLLLIDDEIIFYREKTDTSFVGCQRGFSGVKSFKKDLVFSQTNISDHNNGSIVYNIGSFLVKEFLTKIKIQFTPGFEGRDFYSGLKKSTFIKKSSDFYKIKGSSESFRILFNAIFGTKVSVIKPSENVIEPSTSIYKVTTDVLVEAITGNPEDCLNRTIYQYDRDNNLSYGSITNVEKVIRSGKEFYILSIDFDYNRDTVTRGSIYGDFIYNSTTQVVSEFNIGDTELFVDSTIDFENVGSLYAIFPDGDTQIISYSGSTINQFLGISFDDRIIPEGTRLIDYNFSFVYVDDGVVEVRICPILSDSYTDDGSIFLQNGDPLTLVSLGQKSKRLKSNDWIFNVATKNNVKTIELKDSRLRKYEVQFYENSNFFVGDQFKLYSSSGDEYNLNLLSRNGTTRYSFSSDKLISNINSLRFFTQRKISKTQFLNFRTTNKFASNVQNIYLNDYEDEVYITSGSLPNYGNSTIDIQSNVITFSGNYNNSSDNYDLIVPKHPFITGDLVIYIESTETENRLTLNNSSYFVKVVDKDTIRLSTSRSKIFNDDYLLISGNVSNNKLYHLTNDSFNISDLSFFIDDPSAINTISHQRLIKLLKNPSNESIGTDNIINPGKIGIFKNGVEIISYKSSDKLFYGKINSINILSEGLDYDVLNPPKLVVNDVVSNTTYGSGYEGFVEVSGGLLFIDILNPGIGFINDPIVTITGGNGSGALAVPSLESIEYILEFDSQSDIVDLDNNVLTFPYEINFKTGEVVKYSFNSGLSVGGLGNGLNYYVKVVNNFTIKLFSGYNDLLSNTNEIDLTSFGYGIHTITALTKRKIISKIQVVSSGSNYSNKTLKFDSEQSLVNIYSDTINLNSHGFSTGEIIQYKTTGLPIQGLTNNTLYYVYVIDDNNIKIVNLIESDLSNKIFINLQSNGSGVHTISYEPIEVKVESLDSSSNNTLEIRPIFRGSIKSVWTYKNGQNYGSQDILNYNRQPEIYLENGLTAKLKPIISDGRIISVVVENAGYNYYSVPELVIYGTGQEATLIPIIVNGQIDRVIIQNPGIGYDKDTFIDVVPAGSGAKFSANIQTWRINLVERRFNDRLISSDDGFISRSLNQRNSTQYVHAYAPRKLREYILTKRVTSGIERYVSDIRFSSIEGRELDSEYHSPILGWAYDGNPIYGPYGFSNSNGTGKIKRLKSGYIKSSKANRPDEQIYPLGFFVEDYDYYDIGDLDSHNGRFCVTPEYPNGVYAYFCTIGDIDPVFQNYRRPEFPYVVGNTYKSKKIDFNFKKISQNDFNYENVYRNTTAYNLFELNSGYDYINQGENILKHKSFVSSVYKGNINSVNIISKGTDYRIGDQLQFNDEYNSRFGAKSTVSLLEGKEITSIGYAITSINDVTLHNYVSGNVAITSSPHNLDSGLIFFYDEEKQIQLNVIPSDNKLILSDDILNADATGITTYIPVFGNLNYPNVIVNDILTLGDEEVKVLEVDKKSSRVRILRQYNGAIGYGHTAGLVIREKSRKLLFNSNTGSSKKNDELYFNPVESVGVGIGTTLTIQNPGIHPNSVFVNENRIYLKEHGLDNNTEVTYKTNGGFPLLVSSGASSFRLFDGQTLYTRRFNSNFIGLSTNKSSLSSDGSIIGIATGVNGSLLKFEDFGLGDRHSLVTNLDDVKKVLINRASLTINTKDDHLLENKDLVNLSLSYNNSETIKVVYNDENRRFGVNPIFFPSSSVNIQTNTVTIENHSFINGQKIIYTSSQPIQGLFNNKIYYIGVIDKNTIYFAQSLKDTKNNIRIDLTLSSFGNILPINPTIFVKKNKNLIFDLSDESLSYIKNLVRYSAFEFKLFANEDLTDELVSTKLTNKFNVTKTGSIGISVDAKVEVKFDGNIPDILYYALVPIKNIDVPNFKYEILIDEESRNAIKYVDSFYNLQSEIIKLTNKSFKIILGDIPKETTSNLVSISNVKYTTDSRNAKGAVSQTVFSNLGSSYTKLPALTQILSSEGKDFLGIVNSNNIGKIKDIKIEDIANDFTSDITLRPIANSPISLKIEPLASVEKIDITSFGKNYSSFPDLLLIDGLTNKPVFDLNVKYNELTSEIDILTNTNGIYNVTPSIIPINNSGGYKILSLNYDTFTKNATVVLDTVGFSTLSAFPFTVGSKLLIENVVTINPETDLGYNSKNYDYSLFTVVSNDPNIGGQLPSVTFSMGDYVGNVHPGFYNDLFTTGRIVPQSHFPKFNVTLKKNEFFKNEVVTQNNFSGVVLDWDKNNEILKVETSEYFNLQLNNLIEGLSSKSFGTVSNISGISTTKYSISSSIKRNKDWDNKKGFLNEQTQRLHDSDYYQYFSYALNSIIPLDSWDSLVGELNHTAGFKRFSNLSINSIPNNSILNSNQNEGDFLGISNIDGYADLNCIYDYDLVTENSIQLGLDDYISDEIRFNSKLLQDYFESVGNRVLIVDDISDEFNSNARATRFAIIDEFRLDEFKYKKYFIHSSNKLFTTDRQSIIVNLLQDGSYGYLNQYGRVETVNPHGYFDFTVFGSYGYLLYYPIEYQYDDYNVSGISINIGEQLVGIGTTTLGDIVSIASTYRTIPSGSSSGIPIIISNQSSEYRSVKYTITVESNDGSYIQADELNVVHDGSSVYSVEFANLESSTFTSDVGVGFCTYYPDINGSQLVLSLIPNYNPTQNFKVNVITTSISDDTLTSIGQTILNTARIESEYTNILGSPTPSPEIVTSISREYKSFYILASIEDSTNNYYQFTELVGVRDRDEVYFTEFGRVVSDEAINLTGIGTFSGVIDGVTDETEIYFEPLSNRNVNVRTIIYSLETVDLAKSYTSIDLDQSNLSTLYGDYYGTENDIRRSFELLYKGVPIFERKFNSEDPDTVLLNENTIRIPNHFFVTGEKITYTITENSFIPDSAIGIQTAIISGISTDKLPNELYVIKINESKLQFAATVEDALKYNPIPLVLSSTGIGTQHKFTAINKDAKCLFSIDNMIQSPVTNTDIVFSLTKDVTANDVYIKLSGISSVFASDLLQINDEIVLVERVGVSSEQLIRVRRRWMGEKGAVAHGIGSTVTKLAGNYTIYGNQLDFASAPYGKVPLSVPQNQVGAPIIRPDDRDFVGITTNSYFSGRVFLRRGITDSTKEVYEDNLIFDDLSTQFTGIKSDFTLKQNGSSVSGISSNNGMILIKDIFQQPARTGVASVPGNYTLEEIGGETKITFYPSIQDINDDINVTALPVGGVIISVGSTSGYAYQPLISAGATATISGFGTISNISIGNSGSGYRSGIQTTINVYAQTSLSTQIIGIASADNGRIVSVNITNPGSGYTSSNPPEIIIDSPLGYSNIPLIYSNDSVQGVGTGAKIDLIVSQDSSVLEFNIKNNGYSYKEGEILTVDIGGSLGIPTDISKSFEEFQIKINSVYHDEFSGWTLGDIQQLDSIENLFDGVRRVFPIKFKGDRVSIIAKNGSNIDVEATLIIFINGILQIPGKSYTFKGGSILIFSEPPKKEYTSNILFYRGTPDIDVRLVDLIEEIEVGDTARIHSNSIFERQNKRTIEEILSADIVLTNTYSGPGRIRDEITQRPVNICRQTEDLIINGEFISKKRSIYEPLINPTTNIIQNVSVGSTDVFVESLKTFFDSESENISTFEASQIEIISQDRLEVGLATATVSSSGSITSINISNSGYGYTFAPSISISEPPKTGTEIKSECELIIADGIITSYNITNSGRGYDPNNPPQVIIEYPKLVTEKIINVNYEGDFGTISGVALTTVGAGLTAIALDFYIDEQSYLRNPNINSGVQYSSGISGISTGYFFVVSNSNIGLGITSLYNNQSVLSTSENYFDNVFQVYDLEIKEKVISGIGTTSIVEVHCLTQSDIDLTLPTFDSNIVTFDSTEFTFDSNSNDFSYFGNYSWGRITFDDIRSRKDRKNFTSYYQNGYSGISTSSIIKRSKTLRYDLYSNIV